MVPVSSIQAYAYHDKRWHKIAKKRRRKDLCQTCIRIDEAGNYA